MSKNSDSHENNSLKKNFKKYILKIIDLINKEMNLLRIIILCYSD